MAKFTPILGSLRGKIGDVVFSFNRSGAYIRAKGLTVNPNSTAQLASRNTFSSSSNSYHSLSNAAKALWQAFAPFYRSKTGVVGSNPSGFNVFVGMQNSARTLIRTNVTATVKKNNTGSAVAGTYLLPATTLVAPSGQLISTLNADAGPVPIVVNQSNVTATITSAGVWSVSLDIPSVIGPTMQSFTSQIFQDSSARIYGFMAQISRPKQQANQFFGNMDNITLGSMVGYTPTAPITGASSITVGISGTLVPGDYDAFPQTGEVINLDIFQVGQSGMTNKLVSKKITIT